MLKMTESSVQSRQVRQFEDLFVQRHNNVSILYADIVNFTPLSGDYNTSISISQLSGAIHHHSIGIRYYREVVLP